MAGPTAKATEEKEREREDPARERRTERERESKKDKGPSSLTNITLHTGKRRIFACRDKWFEY